MLTQDVAPRGRGLPHPLQKWIPMKAARWLLAVLSSGGLLISTACSPTNSTPSPGPTTKSSDEPANNQAGTAREDEVQPPPTPPVESPPGSVAETPIASAPADSGPGIGVAEKAPSFSLPDQQGQERTLEELLQAGNVALVFYRSADW